MTTELPQRAPVLFPFRYKRYFEPQNALVRVFGRCEITGDEYECFVPTDEFYTYLQGEKTVGLAMPSTKAGDREFLMTGTSPQGWKKMWGK